jgi:hypothetical protein
LILPATLAVQRPHSEQPPHAVPNVALPWPLMLRVTPTGQVTVRLTSSTAKSSMLNPPGTARPGRCGFDQIDVAALYQFGTPASSSPAPTINWNAT